MSNFDSLPQIEFADLNTQRILDNIIAGFERAQELAGVENSKLFPGDPRRLFLQTIAYYIIIQNNRINEAGLQNLLPFATGGFLDALGALYGERGRRLPASYAVTTLEFSLSAAQPTNMTIPMGTRVTPGNNLFFATDELLLIPAGQTSGTVRATCMTAGIIGSGFLAGQINIIVDRNNPFVQSAQNITASSAGADIESDNDYKERLYLVPESFSTAGPRDSYKFWAMTASADITDVGVYSPEPDLRVSSPFRDFLAGYGISDASAFWVALTNFLREEGTGPGHVNIVPLMKGGELPTPDIIDKVLEICNDETRRPLTDFVHVVEPEVVYYNIDLTFYVSRNNAPLASTIETAVRQAVDDFVLWQKTALGRDINRSELVRRVMNAGAKRVVVPTPTFMVLEQNEVGIAFDVVVNFGGLEDD